jgi:hypothetical protein
MSGLEADHDYGFLKPISAGSMTRGKIRILSIFLGEYEGKCKTDLGHESGP